MTALWWVALALAEPAVLRDAAEGPRWAAAVGTDGVGVGAWLPSGLGLAADVPWSGATVGVSAGGAWGRTRGRGRLEAGVAGGPLGLLVDPGIGLAASAWAGGGLDAERVDLRARVVVPAAVRLGPDPAWRLPVQLEPHLGVTVGAVEVGVAAALGATFAAVQAPALVADARLLVGLRR